MPDTKSTTLFSLATVKAWCRVTGVDTSDDDRLIIAANAASEELENETSRIFVKRDLTETSDGNGRRALAVQYAPLTVVTSVSIDGTVVDSANYLINVKLGIITLKNQLFTIGSQNIIISYTAGWDVKDGSSLPSDVVRAGLDLTKAIWNELTANAIAATSVSLGASTMIIKAAKRPPSMQRVIDMYKSARLV